MRNSSIYRSNLSDEKIAFLSEIKNQKDTEQESVEPRAYKRQSKQKELDLLWQNFKFSPKEEKSPGIYLLTGFIAGALCMFLMNAVLSLGSNVSNNDSDISLGQPKFEKKISRKSMLPQINSNQTENEVKNMEVIPAKTTDGTKESLLPLVETYTVKQGDSMSSIVIRFYGKYDNNKIEKIRQANNLSNAAKLSIGQKLIIPLD